MLIHLQNWKAEFHKWLGKDRVGISVGDKKKDIFFKAFTTRWVLSHFMASSS